MSTITYHSNNSGGSWWLTDQNWKDLEASGWKVDWYADRKDDLFGPYPDGRWLDALASSATREGLTMGEAIEEWERVTGQDSAALGCSCCGTPHSFSSDDGEWYSPDFPSSGSRYQP